jgi:RNA polymerase sigma factor for flagellar operon FliA
VARERFLESHVDLVRYLALRIAHRVPAGVEVEDMIHDGVVGLLDAFEKYDPARGVLFRTYAESRVRGAILDGLRRKDWRPRSVRTMQRELDAVIGQLSSQTGRMADEDEIAAAMGVNLETYRSLLHDLSIGPLLSLEDLGEGSERVVAAAPRRPDRFVERKQLIEALAEEIRCLPERECRVLVLYYQEALNMKEIGAVLGVTESRVCQIHAQAAARLRVALRKRLHARPSGRAAVPRASSGTGRKR